MKIIKTYSSPHINYEIFEENSFYHISVYVGDKKSTPDPERHITLRDFSRDLETAEIFTKAVSSAAALPIHMEELAESFLSR